MCVCRRGSAGIARPPSLPGVVGRHNHHHQPSPPLPPQQNNARSDRSVILHCWRAGKRTRTSWLTRCVKGFVKAYAAILASAADPEHPYSPFRTVLQHLAESAEEEGVPKPLLIHCTAGKDSTCSHHPLALTWLTAHSFFSPFPIPSQHTSHMDTPLPTCPIAHHTHTLPYPHTNTRPGPPPTKPTRTHS